MKSSRKILLGIVGLLLGHVGANLRRERSSEALLAENSNDVVTKIICSSAEAAAFLGFKCIPDSTNSNPGNASPSDPTLPSGSATSPSTPTTTPPPAPTPTTAPPVSQDATYDLHALAIGDWGVDLGLGSCCNQYRQTGVNNPAYYEDMQAQPNVAYLLALSAAKLSPKPKAILSHGDNFYWNGLGSDDVQHRFTNSFEAMYNQLALQDIPWFNVLGNHDYGGSMFICGKADGQFQECASTTDLLNQLEQKFTRQANYVSPNGDRWHMPAHYYVKTLTNPAGDVTVDVYNVDTNFATVHGAMQICCQCYGYLSKYGGKVACNDVSRGNRYCAGGDTSMFDACMNKIQSWQSDSLQQLKNDASKSKATWKVVNSHYSPHFHMDPVMMAQWNDVLAANDIQLFINGHTHAESHEYGDFKTHFVTNGAGGGIQSESIGEPPAYATQIHPMWIASDAPYGTFALSFNKQQMRIQFVTFDSKWSFLPKLSDTVRGGMQVTHCWLIPIDGSKGAPCTSTW